MSQQQEGMSRRELRRMRRRQADQRNRLVTIGIVVLFAALAAAVLIWPILKPVGAITMPEPLDRGQVDANTAGDPDAPITLTEFGDFQCPYCRTFYEDIEPDLVDTFIADGTVLFIYRSFGEFIGAESKASAEAAYCAGDQGKFWEMHDMLFANQQGENIGDFTNRRLVAFAEALALDMDVFRDCYHGGKYADRVDQDRVDGLDFGISGTPAFIMTYLVNGEMQTELISGAVPFSEFESRIQNALAEVNAQ